MKKETLETKIEEIKEDVHNNGALILDIHNEVLDLQQRLNENSLQTSKLTIDAILKLLYIIVGTLVLMSLLDKFLL